MPNKVAIQQEVLALKEVGQDQVRRKYLKDLADYTGRDTIIYAMDAFSVRAASRPPLSLQINRDDIQGFMSALYQLSGDKLDIILHSGGGSVEAAELIVNYLRGKYQHIRAIVPMSAMSAATMLSCACDEIVMGKHSCLGPVDPQMTLPTQNGLFTAPAFSILNEFDQAMKDVQTNPNSAVLWGAKIKDYPPGILTFCRQATVHSKTKVHDWLKRYMFNNAQGSEVLADDISSWLANADIHKSHGHPITYAEAKAKGLRVSSLESDQELQEKVLSVFHSIIVTFDLSNCAKFIENQNGLGYFWNMAK